MSLPIQHGSALILDDNTFHRKLLRSILRTSGFYHVTEFDNIEHGLEEAQRTYPNFVFLDFDTGTASDLARGNLNLRTKFLHASTHLIILLEHPTRNRVTNAISHGANWVISRPFSSRILTTRLQAVIDPSKVMRVRSIHPSSKTQPFDMKGIRPPILTQTDPVRHFDLGYSQDAQTRHLQIDSDSYYNDEGYGNTDLPEPLMTRAYKSAYSDDDVALI
ncbi:response regulator [uncultured Cohaesibacter sp.]|uniref:response regulator n=1 Tax=uncultured Cohaesibacter sp. TaxID=1002546 RepID=UPI0029306935|nr:response regulator [uncultured Cohaesibacter sp.]